MIFANATAVFIESNIQDPMEAIFDAPILTGGFQDAFGIRFQAGDLETSFDCLFAIDNAFSDNHDEAL